MTMEELSTGYTMFIIIINNITMKYEPDIHGNMNIYTKFLSRKVTFTHQN